MSLSKTLIPDLLLALFLFLFQFLVAAVSQAEDTTIFSYDSFSKSSKDLVYQGDAFVPSSSSFVRMTKVDASGNPVPQSVGRVVYSPPVKFWDTNQEATFETTIKFSIEKVDDDPGDGFTFFIIPVGSPIPDPGVGGRSFGLFNFETGLAPSVFAVEFDIYYGSDNTWDPRYPHIGIDINSRDSVNVSRYEDSLGEVVTARINYEESTRTVRVSATYGSKNVSLSYVYDLKKILPKQVQVGISAATGGSSAFHDLYYWHFSSALVWDGDNHQLPDNIIA
ncbi:hypothetical protein ACS0TY_007717 [Phlomoides rotata]